MGISSFVQPKDTLKEIWEGRRPGVEGAVANWPIDFAHSIDDLGNILSEMIAKSSRIMHRMGIMSKVDDLVVDAIKKRDRHVKDLVQGQYL